jgi:hypothetical protein
MGIILVAAHVPKSQRPWKYMEIAIVENGKHTIKILRNPARTNTEPAVRKPSGMAIAFLGYPGAPSSRALVTMKGVFC